MPDGDEYECPTCDYTSGSEGGVSIHHYQAHGESIAKSEYECDVCGTVTERYDCETNGDVHFCSTECESEYKSNIPKEEHSCWKGDEGNVECHTCGSGFRVIPSRANKTKRLFCSAECRSEWMAESMAGDGNPNYDSVEVECEWCGTSFEKIPVKLERDDHNFCTHNCHNQWMAEYQHGPNHHQWTGGRRDYGPGWNERKRESVRERDGRECFDCGITESESIAEYGRKLDVHHLVPPDSDTNPAVHNAKRNLVTLCIPCHHQWEAQNDLTDAVAVSTEVCEI